MPIIHLEDGIPPSNSKFVTLGGAFNDTVASFATYTKTFTPPRGKKWGIIGMRLTKGAPTGAATGIHQFLVGQAGVPMVAGTSVFGSKVEWGYNCWIVADSEKLPVSDTAALLALHAVVADADNPLVISYLNATDVTNNKLGELIVHVLEEPII